MNKYLKSKIFFTIFFISCLAKLCLAASPISQVGSPEIEAQKLAINSRFGIQGDKKQNNYDNYFQMRHHIDYGFKDWYAFRLIAFFDKKDDQDIKYNELGFENRFQIFKKDKNGWDNGFRLNYYSNNSIKNPDSARFSILSNFPFGQFFEFRNNIIFDHEIGKRSSGGIYLTVRNQISRKFYTNSNYIRINELSLALFSDLNKFNKMRSYDYQEHEIRLINTVKLKNNLNLDLGYGVGISKKNANRNISLSIGKDF